MILLPDYITKEWCAEHTKQDLRTIFPNDKVESVIAKLYRRGWKLRRMKKAELPKWFTEEYVNNHTGKELAERYGCDDRWIRQICCQKKWKIKRVPNKSKLASVPTEELQEMTRKEIMAKYKMNSQAVGYFLNKNNIVIKPPMYKKDQKKPVINNVSIKITSNELDFTGMINVRPKSFLSFIR